MSTSDLEQRVAAGLYELADGPVPTPPMFDHVADRVRRRRRYQVAAASSAAAVVATLVIGGLLLRPPTGPPVAGAVTAVPCPSERGRSASGGPVRVGPLVPGRPVVATVCRYHGLNQVERVGSLAATATVSGAEVAALTAALNAGEPIPAGPVSCPADYGEAVRVTFGYRDRPPVVLEASLTGCTTASTGGEELRVSEAAYRQLTELVGKDPS